MIASKPDKRANKRRKAEGGGSEQWRSLGKKTKNKSSLVSAAANETFPCMHTMEHVHTDVDVANTEGGGGWGGVSSVEQDPMR